MDKRHTYLDKIKEIPLWIRTSITFFTLIFGFITLLINNVHLGITILVGLFLCSGFSFCIYIIFSKRKSELADRIYVYRFPQYRYLASVGIIFFAIIFTRLLILESSRSFAVVAFIGTPTPNPTPTPNLLKDFSIVSMIIAERADVYRVEINIYNPLERDVFVNKVTLNQYSDDGTGCSGGGEATYVFSDTIVVTSEDEQGIKFNVPLSPQDESLSGYQYNAQGFFYQHCASNEFEISFESSLILTAKGFATLLLNVPKVLTVTQKEYNDQSPTTKELNVILNPDQLDSAVYNRLKNFRVQIALYTDIDTISYTKYFIGTPSLDVVDP